jgi:hypothetical protein
MRDFFRASIAKGRGEEGRANPLFPAAKIPRWKKWILASSALVVPLGGGIFGVHALSQPAFLISNIVITGTACLDQNEVRAHIEKFLEKPSGIFFTRENRLFFKPSTLENDLKADFPLERADISVEGTTLKVAVTEDVVMLLFHSGEAWLLTDLEGKVLRSLSPEEISELDSPTPSATSTLPFDKIPKIILNEAVAADIQEPLYPAERLTALAELDKGLRHLGLTPERYTLDKRRDTWLAVTVKEQPFTLYVDLENDVAAQLKILSGVLTENTEFGNAHSIDLRFGNRVYLK